jgi:hypothetical protein
MRCGRYCPLSGGLRANYSVNDPVWNGKSYIGQIKNAGCKRIFLMNQLCPIGRISDLRGPGQTLNRNADRCQTKPNYHKFSNHLSSSNRVKVSHKKSWFVNNFHS